MESNLDRLLRGSREASLRGENLPDDLPKEIKNLLRDSVPFRAKFVLLYHLVKISGRPDDFEEDDIYQWTTYVGTLLNAFQGRERELVLEYFGTENLPTPLGVDTLEGFSGDEGSRAAEIKRKLDGLTQLLRGLLREASGS